MIDFTKPVETVSGEPVEIITTKGRGEYPIVGYLGLSDIIQTWTKDGLYDANPVDPRNLRNVKTKHKGFVNIYRANGNVATGLLYDTADEAKHATDPARTVATAVPIEWEE